jgi:hypothetical protein
MKKNSDNNAGKIFRLCMLIFMAAVFLVVVPTHHHDDGKEHSDCVLCVLVNQDFILPVIISVTLSAFLLFTQSIFHSLFIPSRTPQDINSRAPPLY